MNDPGDRATFLRAITVLVTTMNEPMSEARLEGYWLALQDLPIDTVEHGLAHALRSARFFPKPAEIREALLGTVEDRARNAWRRVLAAIAHVGTYRSVDFGDLVTHAVIDRMGGWHQVWGWERLEGPELLGMERDFVSLYRLCADRRPTEAPQVLLGQHARCNRALGALVRGVMPLEEVVLLDPRGAAQERRALAAHAGVADG